jgi:uncharacterized iron-regulated protein
MKRRDLLLAALAVAAGCAGPRLELGDAPLAGRAWDARARRFLERGEVERRIAAADCALLGETHDNPEHHRIQLALLRSAVAAGRRPALAMEQLDVDRQAAVDRALADAPTPETIAKDAQVSSGWEWPLYAPLVELAVDERLPLVALNLPRSRTGVIVKEGLAAVLGEGEIARLALDRTWNAARQAALEREIVEGHCGDAGPIVARLVDVQRAKDAVMADRILAHRDRGVVAILGRGHARADLGVPLYLAARAPRLAIVTLGMVEIESPGRAAPDYDEAAPGRFDIVWFTPRARRPDPCAGFKGVPPPRPAP